MCCFCVWHCNYTGQGPACSQHPPTAKHMGDQGSICVAAGLRYTARAVVLSTVVASLHSLVAVQVLVLCAFLTPNQDLAFVLAVSYDVLSSLLAGVWVYIGNLVCMPIPRHADLSLHAGELWRV